MPTFAFFGLSVARDVIVFNNHKSKAHVRQRWEDGKSGKIVLQPGEFKLIRNYTAQSIWYYLPGVSGIDPKGYYYKEYHFGDVGRRTDLLVVLYPSFELHVLKSVSLKRAVHVYNLQASNISKDIFNAETFPSIQEQIEVYTPATITAQAFDGEDLRRVEANYYEKMEGIKRRRDKKPRSLQGFKKYRKEQIDEWVDPKIQKLRELIRKRVSIDTSVFDTIKRLEEGHKELYFDYESKKITFPFVIGTKKLYEFDKIAQDIMSKFLRLKWLVKVVAKKWWPKEPEGGGVD